MGSDKGEFAKPAYITGEEHADGCVASFSFQEYPDGPAEIAYDRSRSPEQERWQLSVEVDYCRAHVTLLHLLRFVRDSIPALWQQVATELQPSNDDGNG